jgi:hypothetical protein
VTPKELAVVLAALACVAALCSSVGHAGASGCLAVMALVGTVRPVAEGVGSRRRPVVRPHPHGRRGIFLSPLLLLAG